jgi:5'-nucleotidase
MIRRLLPLVLAPLLLTGCASVTPSPPVTVGIIAINDFHGALEPPRQAVPAPDGKGGVVVVPSGGAAWLASAIDSIRAKYPHHLTVSAGDMIGGTPITSAIFLDEPAIGAMNMIGLDFNAAGNHEFDSGSTSCCASRPAAAPSTRRASPARSSRSRARSSASSPPTPCVPTVRRCFPGPRCAPSAEGAAR